jgi:hypothetical protein
VVADGLGKFGAHEFDAVVAFRKIAGVTEKYPESGFYGEI